MDVDQFFLNSHYNLNRIQLSISGLWPFHSKIRRYTTYFVLTLVLGSGFFFQVMGVLEVRHDSFEIVDALPMLNFVIVCLFKMIYAVYALSQIKLLLLKIQEYCLSPKSDKEYVVLIHVVLFNLATLLTKIMYKETEKNVTSSNEMVDTQIGVPYRVNYMIDLDTYYTPIFIHIVICNICNMFIEITYDVFFISLVEHCRGLFAAFRYRLENAYCIENDSKALTKTSIKYKSYLNVAYSIQRHEETMQFIDIMNSVYSIPLFMHVGLIVMTLSILGYQVITSTQSINRVLKHASFLNGLLINIFFENWQGQRIIDSSEKVFESAYNVEWYNLPIAARKLLVLIMIRSIKPMVLKAGKFVILSYVTFNTIIRTSSSYFMLLRSVT